MSPNKYLVPEDQLPSWLNYPRAYRRLVEQELYHLTPWHFLDGEEALARYRGLSERYPSRVLFPFAYRQDNDDFACWSKSTGEEVLVVHDFASPGWENVEAFVDTWAWFRRAVEETIHWD